MGLLPAEQIQTLLGRLKQNGMLASYYPTAREAAAAILLDIPPDATVGVGGSITIRVMGLPEALTIRGQKVYDHWKEETKKARHALGRLQQHADYFLTSTNALTMNGELVNIDASGNRVTSMIFGPAACDRSGGGEQAGAGRGRRPGSGEGDRRPEKLPAPPGPHPVRAGPRVPRLRFPAPPLQGHDHHRAQALRSRDSECRSGRRRDGILNWFWVNRAFSLGEK